MADFKATVERLVIEEHPNADALELAVIGGYRSIVRKDTFQTGDLAVYIPEQAVLPEWLISNLGLEGRLSGKAQNRVKAIKLRGVLSQGLVLGLGGDQEVMFPVDSGSGSTVSIYIQNEISQMGVGLGDDVTEFLGITKYEPKIPTSMSGEVFNAFGCTLKYDIENIKRYPDVFGEDEIVIITEKLHGTWACFGYHPEVDHPIVSSKGLSDRGLAFKFVEENFEKNLYVRTFKKFEDALQLAKNFFKGEPVYILGEIFGTQDLRYGVSEPTFRVFDIYVGEPGQGGFMNAYVIKYWVPDILKIETVPYLYQGPFDKDTIEELTDGNEMVSGTEANIREGIVIKPMIERRDNEIGRVVLKSVSEKYLLRKGNATEYA